MKVNLSYTVSIEEVLDNVRYLFIKTEEDYREKEEHLLGILKGDYTDANIGEVATALADYKKILAGLEAKLSEINNILSGYYQLKHSPPPPEPQEDEFNVLEGVEDE